MSKWPSGIRTRDDITGNDLLNYRKFMALDERMAAEIVGTEINGKIQIHSWQDWEAGRSAVPADVADYIAEALNAFKKIKKEIFGFS